MNKTIRKLSLILGTVLLLAVLIFVGIKLGKGEQVTNVLGTLVVGSISSVFSFLIGLLIPKEIPSAKPDAPQGESGPGLPSNDNEIVVYAAKAREYIDWAEPFIKTLRANARERAKNLAALRESWVRRNLSIGFAMVTSILMAVAAFVHPPTEKGPKEEPAAQPESVAPVKPPVKGKPAAKPAPPTPPPVAAQTAAAQTAPMKFPAGHYGALVTAFGLGGLLMGLTCRGSLRRSSATEVWRSAQVTGILVCGISLLASLPYSLRQQWETSYRIGERTQVPVLVAVVLMMLVCAAVHGGLAFLTYGLFRKRGVVPPGTI